MTATLAELAAKLEPARTVLLTCHRGPDGDSLGSMSGLAALLWENGRSATLYNPDPAPRTLRQLPFIDTLVSSLTSFARFDATIVVDCGDRRLLGDRFPGPDVTGPLLVLDHHATTRPFGEVYVCDPGASSVGVLVARLARELGWPLSRDAAAGIYVSLVADTGSFRYANTNEEAFLLAAELVGLGVDPWAISETLHEQAPLARYRLLAAVLAGLTVEGPFAFLAVTDEMVRAAGARWEDTDGLVNYARGLEGVEVGVLLSPNGGGTRVSLRSKGRIDAGAVCGRLGGGGHRGAAGCLVPLPLDETRAVILDALRAEITPSRPPDPPAGPASR